MKNKKTDLQLEKNKIRKEILGKRNTLSTEEVEKKSDLIIQNLEKFIKNAENIMIFMDMKNEVRITKLMKLYPEKSFFIPKITDSKNREMKINKYEGNELVLQKFGYYESSSSDFYNENILDIVIVPAVVFDLEKNRIGFGGGDYDTFLKKIRGGNKKVLFLPFITIISSLAGGAVASILLSLSVGESVAISAGMGWYSFSAIELSKVSVELGGIAFLANIFRELLAIFLIPVIAKKIGSFESVSVAGATAMDSVLPIINRSNPAEISIISFYSGLVISIIVPILIPILVNIFSL